MRGIEILKIFSFLARRLIDRFVMGWLEKYRGYRDAWEVFSGAGNGAQKQFF